MALNVVAIMGRLCSDPEIRFTEDGVAVCTFRMAEGSKDKTNFFDVVAWNKNAEFVTKNFKKGNMIAVTGKINTKTYTKKDGTRVESMEIVAEKCSYTGEKT